MQPLEVLVHYDGVGRGTGVGAQGPLQCRHLVSEPDIILVREENVLAATFMNGPRKVVYVAESGSVYKHADARIAPLGNDIQRTVGRRVIRDNDLIVRRQLGEDAVQLLTNEFFAL